MSAKQRLLMAKTLERERTDLHANPYLAAKKPAKRIWLGSGRNACHNPSQVRQCVRASLKVQVVRNGEWIDGY